MNRITTVASMIARSANGLREPSNKWVVSDFAVPKFEISFLKIKLRDTARMLLCGRPAAYYMVIIWPVAKL